jgi:hypothetical protein
MSKYEFKKATKSQRKARIALCGVSGSGKTKSALLIASGLGGKIAVIDTENASASLYSDETPFEVLELDRYEPDTYVEAIHAAEGAEYEVLIIDSLSHAWMGKGGALEQVEKRRVQSKSGNSFDAWRHVTPMHNALVDALLHCRCHLIVTMRSKAEYVIEKDEKTGKSVPRKVGMAPVQRDGLEYEFDVVGDIDLDHNWIISKTRCSQFVDAVINKPNAEIGERLKTWLSDGAPVVSEFERLRGLLDKAQSDADIDAARERMKTSFKTGKLSRNEADALAEPAQQAKARIAAANGQTEAVQ